MREFFRKYKKEAALVTGILFCLFFFFVNPLGLAFKAKLVLAIAALMISWWVLDAMPLPVVALVPIVLFPLLDISSLKEVTKSYSDSIIFLFMGGFFIGIAIEKWNLHKRIALGIINITGTNGNRIILGFIIATGFLSMWLSNTATTMMMFPIAVSVISVMSERKNHNGNLAYFNLTIMLAIAYASNIGGIATIIGTPPNVAYIGFFRNKYGIEIDFMSWMALCLPIALLLLAALYIVMVKWLYPNKISSDAATTSFIKQELLNMGPMSMAEKRVLIVFLATACLWIFRSLINDIQPFFKLDDTIIALIGAIIMFVIPSGMQISEDKPILLWSDTNKLAWGILLLFGGGIALADALENAGIIAALGHWLAEFSSGVWIMVFMITVISIFMSEVMSNVAQVIVFAPVVTSLAEAMQVNPLLFGIPMTLAASCAGMLPMGTPPNAIVFGSNHIRMIDMIKIGFVMNVIAIILICLFVWYLVPVIF